jgi:TldD protein
MSADVRPLIRLSVNVVVEQDGRREQATAAAAPGGLSFFLEQDRALGFAREAVRQALVSLEADDRRPPAP